VATTDVAPPVGVAIRVPANWFEFDLHPASRDDNIRRAVNERIREIPELAEHRGELLRLLRRMAREAYDAGAVYCGCMAEDPGEEPLIASLMIAVVSTRAPDGGLTDLDPRAMAAALKTKAARDPRDTWQRVRLIDIAETGAAVCTEGVEDLPVPGTGKTVRMVTMQTFIRVPGVEDRIAVVTATSPALDLQDELLELFEAIGATFRFEYS
jgi:hypothetical protein